MPIRYLIFIFHGFKKFIDSVSFHLDSASYFVPLLSLSSIKRICTPQFVDSDNIEIFKTVQNALYIILFLPNMIFSQDNIIIHKILVLSIFNENDCSLEIFSTLYFIQSSIKNFCM